MLVALLCAGQWAMSQHEGFISFQNQRKKMDFSTARVNNNPQVANNVSTYSYGFSLGQTLYDLQSNYSPGSNRIFRRDDGSIAAVWNRSVDQGSSFADRGPGYGYYNPDSTAWFIVSDMNWQGLATTRSGWPQLISLSSREYVVQHNYGASEIITNKRDTVGMGFWENSVVHNIDAVFPKSCASKDTIHMVSMNPSSTINGIEKPIEYHRSDDGGDTWAINNFSGFPNYDNTLFPLGDLEGDIYEIDAYENYVAIVVGGGWHPLVLFKSDNYGANGSWTTTVIYSPNDAYGHADTANNLTVVPTLSSEISLVIDPTGEVHVASSGFAISWPNGEPVPQNSNDERFSYPLASAGVYYWNESMGTMDDIYNPFVSTTIPSGTYLEPAGLFYDYTGDGIYNIPTDKDSIGYYNGGAAGHTNISLDQNGGLIILWSQVAEMTSAILPQYYRDLYAIRSTNNGGLWGPVLNVASKEVSDDGFSGGTISEEDVFPSAIRRIGADNKLHFIFQTDLEPGMHVEGDKHPVNYANIVYYSMNVGAVSPNSIADKHSIATQLNVYPNPTRDRITISSETAIQDLQNVEVLNLIGRKISNPKYDIYSSREAVVDLNSLSTGVYLLSFEINGERIVKKIVKN